MDNNKTKYPTTWDLTCLCKTGNKSEIDHAMMAADQAKKQLIEKYKGKLTEDNLHAAIAEYENIWLAIDKLYVYAFLNYQTKLNDEKASALYQRIREWNAACGSETCWFFVELQSLDHDKLMKRIKEDPKLVPYAAYIRETFKYKKHTLSANEESIIARLGVVTQDAWYKFHEEMLSKIDFMIGKKKHNLSDIINLASHGRTEKIREETTIALSAGLKATYHALTTIFNNILLSKQISREIRKYENPEDPRYLGDDVSEEIMNAMITAVNEKAGAICHRFYKLKARLLGKDRLQYWDRSAPVKVASARATRKYSYDQAISIILNVFKGFSKTFYNTTAEMVNGGWIDVYPRSGKVSGAFSCSATVDTHPFVLLNFYGDIRDVLTIAHEFGHAIHQKLSSKNKQLVCSPPLNISETASIFAEKLTNKHLLEKEKDTNKKIELMCSRLDDVINTVFRQTAFFKFEQKIHRMRQEGELTHEELNKVWRECLAEYLGPSVELHPCVDELWGYITHFTSSPFYVYSYVFGSLFVEGLYALYEKKGQEFVATYEKILACGGTKTPEEIAKMCNIKLTDSKFWLGALDVIEKEVDDLGKLCDRALCN